MENSFANKILIVFLNNRIKVLNMAGGAAANASLLELAFRDPVCRISKIARHSMQEIVYRMQCKTSFANRISIVP